MVLRIGFNPTRSTSPCHNNYTFMQYTDIQKIHTFTYIHKMNLSTVKWAQWDKTRSRDLLGLFICVCIALCTIVAHNIAQNIPDNFPPYPPDNHHSSDDVYLREGGGRTENSNSKEYTISYSRVIISVPTQALEANFRTYHHRKYQQIMTYCITIYGCLARFWTAKHDA